MAQIGIQFFGLEDVKMVRCFNVLSKCLPGGVADAGSKIWSALSRHNADLTAFKQHFFVYSEWTYDQKIFAIDVKIRRHLGTCRFFGPIGVARSSSQVWRNQPSSNKSYTLGSWRDLEKRKELSEWHFIELHRGFHMASRASQKRSQLARYARSRFEERSSERETFDASVLMERFGQAPWWVVCFWNWWSAKPPNRGSPYWKQPFAVGFGGPPFFAPPFPQKSLRYPVTVSWFFLGTLIQQDPRNTSRCWPPAFPVDRLSPWKTLWLKSMSVDASSKEVSLSAVEPHQLSMYKKGVAHR